MDSNFQGKPRNTALKIDKTAPVFVKKNMRLFFLIIMICVSLLIYCSVKKDDNELICDTSAVNFCSYDSSKDVKVAYGVLVDTISWDLPSDANYDSIKFYRRINPSFLLTVIKEVDTVDTGTNEGCLARLYEFLRLGRITLSDTLWISIRNRLITIPDTGNYIDYHVDSCIQYDYCIGGFAYKCEP
jgi:hypothetical protein